MPLPLDATALDQLFREARTYNRWLPREVDDATLRTLYELLRNGPTAANSSPARVVFVKSAEAKARLKPCLDAGNVDKTMAAPVTAIVAYDLAFYEQLGTLFAHNPGARGWFEGKDNTAHLLRNGSLQGAYLIVAARALGLDCGPMSGFDAAAVDAAFFSGSRWRANFLVNLGYGDATDMRPRNPRLSFEDACRIE
ncbi:putative NADH dehydrogenase/NAD(P)H nitroreductase [Chitiniphilus shinanonensis]|uniref:Putative NADH dehydrogenase/NAD(P)H nitroreductase GCM10007860_24770 n=1 Tax=Chitiniphilus shinanonensis TaxID=553088 RepID=A0ABQ6BVE8_9NEIS|nr:malonic semialdehyde reductase [Chitiniphilus shinanonensis]GLS05326.1 putative NADH dehydrogenase/NAD(P)H nitroreductase [Chitiniphilus shinanonensis]